MVDLPTVDDSELKQVQQLREQFREGEIGMDEYMEQYPEKSKERHREVWNDIYEAHSTSSQSEEQPHHWRNLIGSLIGKFNGRER